MKSSEKVIYVIESTPCTLASGGHPWDYFFQKICQNKLTRK
jgi:hypothetical protein